MNLAQLQRELAAAVMQPLTTDEEMRAETPDGRSMASVAESFIAPNSRLTAFERLEIYNRQYWFRVLGALAEDFPALRSVIGSERFQALSIAYLAAHPSRSFSLRNLGSKLVDWLAANPQWAARRHRLALDVARIEWAFVEAFDSMERTPLTLDQIATLDAASKLSLQPHLQLLALNYPADDLVLTLHDRQKHENTKVGVMQEASPDTEPEMESGAPTKLRAPSFRPAGVPADRSSSVGWSSERVENHDLQPAPVHEHRESTEAGITQEASQDTPSTLPKLRLRPTWLAVHRVDLSVYYRRLQCEEFLTLAAIRQGLPLAEALAAGLSDSRIPEARRHQTVHAWFATWAELGWICAPDLDTLLQA